LYRRTPFRRFLFGATASAGTKNPSENTSSVSFFLVAFPFPKALRSLLSALRPLPSTQTPVLPLNGRDTRFSLKSNYKIRIALNAKAK
jgi:hypothetical protein